MTADETMTKLMSAEIGVSSVKDGTVISLSVAGLKQLLQMAEESGKGRIVVFAQKGQPA